MACVDLSEYSRETLEFAVALTAGFKSRLLIFNVINNRDVDAVATAGHYYPELINIDRFIERTKADRLQRIEALISETFPGEEIKKDVLIEVGVPFESILQAIKTGEVDFVVLGNKGRSNIGRTLLGGNAEKVFRHSPVPVLSVRNRQKFGRKA